MYSKEERKREIKNRLESGLSCTRIAAELQLSLTVVSGVALELGYRSRSGPPLRFDWAVIRSYYEQGHTKRDCRERFGFSKGAWTQAVKRGDIVPRAKPDSARLAHRTRHAVEAGLAQGKTQAEIARELRISKGTAAFHARRIGIELDDRFARRYDWETIRGAYEAGLTAAQCCEKFGCSKASWSQAVARGDIVPRPRREPLDQLLSRGKRRSRFHLKTRLIEAGLKEPRCERCGLASWQGDPVSLELHHVNGDPLDNRIESLQILCPNCHSQTENFGRRGVRESD
jgi:DNA-binding CsgD family transcriptional regulator